MTFRFADREETYQAGDAYYVPPGHTPVHHAGAEVVEFSPTERAHGDAVRRHGQPERRGLGPGRGGAVSPGGDVRRKRARREDRGGARSGARAARAGNELAAPAVVAGRDAGARARDGAAALLVHGGFDNAALWAPILAALAEHHRVLAVDLPGHGLADPFDYEAADLATLSATFLGDVLAGLGLDRVDLVGCSLGGFVTTVFALGAPAAGRAARTGRRAARRDPRPPDAAPDARAGRQAAPRRADAGTARAVAATREKMRTLMGQIAVAHPERLDDEMLDADVLCELRNRDAHLGVVRSLGTYRGMRLRRELCLGERWQELGVPTVFLRGERDVFVSAPVAEAWAAIVERNPSIRIVPVPDAGHLVWLDAPDEVVRGIERALAEDAAVPA